MWPRGRCRVPTGAAKRATTPSSDAPPTRRQLESTLTPRQPPAHRTPTATPTHYSRSRCGTRSLHSRTTNPPHPAYIARLGCTRTRERGAGSSPFFTASLYWSAYYRGFQPAGSVVAQQVYCAQTVFTSCTFHHPHLPEAIGLSRSASELGGTVRMASLSAAWSSSHCGGRSSLAEASLSQRLADLCSTYGASCTLPVDTGTSSIYKPIKEKVQEQTSSLTADLT
jgi:hypothetical protein